MCRRCRTDSGIPVPQRPAEPSYLCTWQSKPSLDVITQTRSGWSFRWASEPQKPSLTISKAIQPPPPPPQYPNDRLIFSSAKTFSKYFHIGVSAHRQWTQNTRLHLYTSRGKRVVSSLKQREVRLLKANSSNTAQPCGALDGSPDTFAFIHQSECCVQQQFPDVLSLLHTTVYHLRVFYGTRQRPFASHRE